MFRFTYLVLRLLFIVLLCLGLRFGLDPVLRLSLAQLGASLTGAKVDLSAVRSSLADTRLFLGDVQIADPRHPEKNLVQFDGAWISLEPRALANGRVVIPHAIVEGIQLDTDRATSGALEKGEPPEEGSIFSGVRDHIASEASQQAELWFADLQGRLEGDLRREFRSIEVSEELIARWRGQASLVDQNVTDWKARVERYRALVRTVKENPLRGAQALSEGLLELDATQKDIAAAQQQIQQWHQQLQIDTEAIQLAKEHDLQRLRELTRAENLDPRALTEYLLGDVVASRLNWAGGWMERAQQLAHHLMREPEINEQQGRGTLIAFNLDRGPGFLIENLAFSGGGNSTGGLTFRGHASNIVMGGRKDGPTIVEFSTNGKFGAQVRAEILAWDDHPKYRIQASLPQFEQPAYELGNNGALAVQVASGTASVWLDMHVDGNQVQGDLRWRQDDLRLAPELSASKWEAVQAGVQTAFGQVQRIHARVDVRGQLESPDWTLKSTLGDDLSNGLQTAVNQALAGYAAEFSQQLDAELEGRMQEANRILQARETSVSEILDLINTLPTQTPNQLSDSFKRIGEAVRLWR